MTTGRINQVARRSAGWGRGRRVGGRPRAAPGAVRRGAPALSVRPPSRADVPDRPPRTPHPVRGRGGEGGGNPRGCSPAVSLRLRPADRRAPRWGGSADASGRPRRDAPALVRGGTRRPPPPGLRLGARPPPPATGTGVSASGSRTGRRSDLRRALAAGSQRSTRRAGCAPESRGPAGGGGGRPDRRASHRRCGPFPTEKAASALRQSSNRRVAGTDPCARRGRLRPRSARKRDALTGRRSSPGRLANEPRGSRVVIRGNIFPPPPPPPSRRSLSLSAARRRRRPGPRTTDPDPRRTTRRSAPRGRQRRHPPGSPRPVARLWY